jgi:glutathione S-transferase
VERVFEIWGECRRDHGGRGEWLFGGFSIADVLYAPVALRFVTYGIPLPAEARPFVDAVVGLGSVRDWVADAEIEPETLDFIDHRLPADRTPLSFG